MTAPKKKARIPNTPVVLPRDATPIEPAEDEEDADLKRVYAAEWQLYGDKTLVVIGLSDSEDLEGNFDEITETAAKAAAMQFSLGEMDRDDFDSLLGNLDSSPDTVIWLPSAARALVGHYYLPEDSED